MKRQAFRPSARIMLLILTGISVQACNEPSPQVPTGARASGSISPSQQAVSFLHHPAADAPAEITAMRANQLALVWATTYGVTIKDYWARQRGGPIPFEALQVCGTTTYVATPFEAPSNEVPKGLRQAVGPWWLVTLCAGATPEMSVGVSAWDTDLEIEPGGLFKNASGADFIPRAIPIFPEYQDMFLETASRALTLASEVAKVPATGTPELVRIPFTMPQFARWRVTLGSQVELTEANDQAAVSTNEVYVGPLGPSMDGGVSVSAPNGRSSFLYSYVNSVGVRQSLRLVVRPGYSIDTEGVQSGPSTK